jgi:fructose-bisphosphate aldolase class 1
MTTPRMARTMAQLRQQGISAARNSLMNLTRLVRGVGGHSQGRRKAQLGDNNRGDCLPWQKCIKTLTRGFQEKIQMSQP